MLVVVENEAGELSYIDGLDKESIKQYADVDKLETVFENGVITKRCTLQQIRERLKSQR